MSAAAALQQARAAGVAFAPEENLMLTALAPRELQSLPRSAGTRPRYWRCSTGACGGSAEDRHAFFEKEAGIVGFEARLPRRGLRLRLLRSPAALPNGSTGSWCNRRQAGASAAVAANTSTTSCCRSAAMPG
ncbi:MAG: hypothetical protein ACJ8C6_20975 [Microvirga sp.]